MYTKKVEDHFRHPHNLGFLEHPTTQATVGNPVCGDVMQLQLEITNGIITDTKFRTFGCAAAIATTSVLTTIIKGKTVSEAKKITFDDIVQKLGGLPPEKIHCSQLAIQALHQALADLEK